jgi:membrane carboxypeptidase/penicillin-binding protein PbpC
MSSSDAEMKPRERSLFTSRLEMAEALQLRLTLAASEVLVFFFLPMAYGASEEGAEEAGRLEQEDEQ